MKRTRHALNGAASGPIKWTLGIFGLLFLLLLVGCSGAKGKGPVPGTHPGKQSNPCEASPDAGAAPDSAESYYNIGACPVDEEGTDGEAVEKEP